MEHSSVLVASPAAMRHASPNPRPRGRAAAYGFGRGLVSGVLATAAMSAVMLAAQKAGLLGEMPPKKISERFLAALGVRRRMPVPARRAAATLSHFAFGGSCGALFGLVHEVARDPSAEPRKAPLAAGLAFGAAIWAISYAGWVPALGIMPRPKYDRPGRPTSMVVAHGVFGAVLAKLVG